MTFNLSQSDVDHILDLIRLNEDEGTYINGQNRWKNKNKKIRKIFNPQQIKL